MKPTPTPIQKLFASKGEFHEPPFPPKPILSSGGELRPGLITMVWAQPFAGRDNENPFNRL
jgi:hypothetical protein